MLGSISNDIKNAFDYGNMITKIILINIAVFIITSLLHAFFPTWFSSILSYIALPGDLSILLYRPWTIISHMFLHNGIFHILLNMLTLYWFGNIAGDLLGDHRILPLYIIGGLFGAAFYVISFQLLPNIGNTALGASAAVLAIVFAAVTTAPNYNIRLILFGNVPIKYIGLFILFIDLIGVGSSSNSGGHIAHLGGTFFGFLFVYLLRKGYDPSNIFKLPIKTYKKTKLKVVHKASHKTIPNNPNIQKPISKVDEILDKIKKSGFESLTQEEKEILYQASKN